MHTCARDVCVRVCVLHITATLAQSVPASLARELSNSFKYLKIVSILQLLRLGDWKTITHFFTFSLFLFLSLSLSLSPPPPLPPAFRTKYFYLHQ